MSAPLKLFLITGQDDDGFNYDLMVQAADAAAAVEFWRDNYAESLRPDDDQEGLDGVLWSGAIQRDDPDPLSDAYEHAARIWEVVVGDTTLSGPVNWAADKHPSPKPNFMRLVAHIPW